MKIVAIELYEMPVKLKEPFVISLGSFEYAENVVVVIRTDEGLSGFGECSPFMPIHGESMETCMVVGRYLATALMGQDPLQIELCTEWLDKVIYGNSCIKSAFDIALYDIAAQKAKLPLYAFLGGKAGKEMATDYTVSLDEPSKMAEDALKIVRAGFPVIKIKLGGSYERDMERVGKIRTAVGPDIPLRIDANQGWDTATAIRLLRDLHPFGIEHCEEPIPKWNFLELPAVRQQSLIPLMADESCNDHHDAARLIHLGACDQLNIKLGKSGGLFKALKIIELAEEAEMELQVGGFLESRLGFTASAHLALKSPNIIYFDFDTPLMFTEDPVSGGIQYGRNGNIALPDGIGLGAWIDADYLRKLKSVRIG
ncbi:MAG: dipeptide epimerase [Marinilabiliales bacterium]|nr:dipeptide epimerase [Marinilabiliales bacterium]